jgi:hypothetical protein
MTNGRVHPDRLGLQLAPALSPTLSPYRHRITIHNAWLGYHSGLR